MNDTLPSSGANPPGPIDISCIQSLRGMRAPVYLHFRGRAEPQPAFLFFTEDGSLYACADQTDGGDAPTGWAPTIRWRIPSRATGSSIADFVIKHRDLFQRAYDGPDGEARKACDEIGLLLSLGGAMIEDPVPFSDGSIEETRADGACA